MALFSASDARFLVTTTVRAQQIAQVSENARLEQEADKYLPGILSEVRNQAALMRYRCSVNDYGWSHCARQILFRLRALGYQVDEGKYGLYPCRWYTIKWGE